jgi:hypothetical protein
VERGHARLSDGDLLGVAAEGALEVRVRGLRLGPVPQVAEVELWLTDAALRRDGFDLHLPRRSRLLVRQDAPNYAVTLEVAEGSGSLAGKPFRFDSLAAQAAARAASGGAWLELERGQISFESLVVAEQPLKAHVGDAAAKLAPGLLELDARAHVEGKDAAVLLEWLDATRAVRMALSMMDAEPFTLSFRLRRRAPRLLLSRLAFESGALTARGKLELEGRDVQRGSVTVLYGGFPIRVRLAPEGATLDLSGAFTR